MRFEQIRLDALDRLSAFATAPCDWQEAPPAGHKAVYCNLVSNLDTLMDLLRYGIWCDDIEVPGAALPANGDEAEQLFRYLGLAFLAVDQVVMDTRDVWKAVGKACELAGRRLDGQLMARINHIWKHRGASDGTRTMHRDHHHGPYVFLDAQPVAATLPSGADWPAVGPGAVLTVPSLPDAIGTLEELISYTDSHLREDGPRDRVARKYTTQVDLSA
ncbi:MAG: hypothetical protein JWN62_3871 [Acidimicrobiales bacterium]|nr:hypothetical protein [Acidimicrobiales bacterium]